MAGSRNVAPARPEHIPYLAAHLRAEERAEVWAAGHLTPRAALERSLAVSDRAWTAFEPGTDRPMAMFGMSRGSLLSEEGGLWGLTTDGVTRWPVPFAKWSRRYVRQMLCDVPVLAGFIDVRCTGGLAWLKWLGARLDAPVPYGPDGRDFQRFEIRREV